MIRTLIADLYANVSIDATKFNQQLGKVQDSLNKVNQKTSATFYQARLLGMGFISAVVGMGAFVKEAISATARTEQLTVAFTNLTGSASIAKQNIKDLKQFAAVTPFEFNGLADTQRKLLAFGFKLESTIPIMTVFGNATSALGSGQEGLDRMAYAFEKVKAIGRISMEEVRMFAEAGINIAEIFNRDFGKNWSRQIEKGAISASKALRSIIDAVQEDPKFFGGMQKQSVTIEGRLSTLRDNIKISMSGIGLAIVQAIDLKGILLRINNFLETFNALMNKKGFQKAFEKMMPAGTIGTAVLGVMVLIQKLTESFGGLFGVLAKVAAFVPLVKLFQSANEGAVGVAVAVGLLIIALRGAGGYLGMLRGQGEQINISLLTLAASLRNAKQEAGKLGLALLSLKNTQNAVSAAKGEARETMATANQAKLNAAEQEAQLKQQLATTRKLRAERNLAINEQAKMVKGLRKTSFFGVETDFLGNNVYKDKAKEESILNNLRKEYVRLDRQVLQTEQEILRCKVAQIQQGGIINTQQTFLATATRNAWKSTVSAVGSTAKTVGVAIASVGRTVATVFMSILGWVGMVMIAIDTFKYVLSNWDAISIGIERMLVNTSAGIQGAFAVIKKATLSAWQFMLGAMYDLSISAVGGLAKAFVWATFGLTKLIIATFNLIPQAFVQILNNIFEGYNWLAKKINDLAGKEVVKEFNFRFKGTVLDDAYASVEQQGNEAYKNVENWEKSMRDHNTKATIENLKELSKEEIAARKKIDAEKDKALLKLDQKEMQREIERQILANRQTKENNKSKLEQIKKALDEKRQILIAEAIRQGKTIEEAKKIVDEQMKQKETMEMQNFLGQEISGYEDGIERFQRLLNAKKLSVPQTELVTSLIEALAKKRKAALAELAKYELTIDLGTIIDSGGGDDIEAKLRQQREFLENWKKNLLQSQLDITTNLEEQRLLRLKVLDQERLDAISDAKDKITDATKLKEALDLINETFRNKETDVNKQHAENLKSIHRDLANDLRNSTFEFDASGNYEGIENIYAKRTQDLQNLMDERANKIDEIQKQFGESSQEEIDFLASSENKRKQILNNSEREITNFYKSYTDKMDELILTKNELIEIEKQEALMRAETMGLSTVDIENYYRLIQDPTPWEMASMAVKNWSDTIKTASQVVSDSIGSALSGLISAPVDYFMDSVRASQEATLALEEFYAKKEQFIKDQMALGKSATEAEMEFNKQADSIRQESADKQKDIFKNLQTTLKNIAVQILKDFSEMLLQMMTKWLIFKAVTGFAGGAASESPAVAGAITGISGARASGGPVAERKPYLVGERGPEIFIPSMTGKIIPNSQIKQPGFGAPNVTVNNQPPNFVINIENNSGQEIKAKTSAPQVNGGDYIVGVVIDAVASNKQGLGDLLKSM